MIFPDLRALHAGRPFFSLHFPPFPRRDRRIFRFPQAFFFFFCRLFGISIDFLIQRILFVILGIAELDHFPIDVPIPIGDHTDNPAVAVAVFHRNGDRFAPDQLDQF